MLKINCLELLDGRISFYCAPAICPPPPLPLYFGIGNNEDNNVSPLQSSDNYMPCITMTFLS